MASKKEPGIDFNTQQLIDRLSLLDDKLNLLEFQNKEAREVTLP